MHIGTLLYTWWNGVFVGEDALGNRYYTSKIEDVEGKRRRWVLYAGVAEPSKVPPEGHLWLHYTVDHVLQERYEWQKPSRANLTGSDANYRPLGHWLSGGKRATATGDYEAWKPE